MIKFVISQEYSTAGKPEVCFGFSIEKLNNNTFNYTLNFFVNEGRGGRQSIPSPKDKSINPFQLQPDLVSYDLWMTSGYLQMMKIINDIILQDVTKNSAAKIDFGMIAQNYTSFKKDNQGGLFSGVMPLFLVIGYLSPLIVLIYR